MTTVRGLTGAGGVYTSIADNTPPQAAMLLLPSPIEGDCCTPEPVSAVPGSCSGASSASEGRGACMSSNLEIA